MVEDFAEFLRSRGRGEDPRSVTPQDVRAYADHLRHERGMKAKTINGKYLAALRSVYRVGVDRFKVEKDPTAGIMVRAERAREVRSKGFTEAEAMAVLRAAKGAKHPAHRWVPWLCAYTGARVGEIAQLRRQDFEVEEATGIRYIRITPEAGSVKSGKFRLVPLHSHLIEEGILNRPEFPGG
jgi:integrase